MSTGLAFLAGCGQGSGPSLTGVCLLCYRAITTVYIVANLLLPNYIPLPSYEVRWLFCYRSTHRCRTVLLHDFTLLGLYFDTHFYRTTQQFMELVWNFTHKVMSRFVSADDPHPLPEPISRFNTEFVVCWVMSSLVFFSDRWSRAVFGCGRRSVDSPSTSTTFSTGLRSSATNTSSDVSSGWVQPA